MANSVFIGYVGSGSISWDGSAFTLGGVLWIPAGTSGAPGLAIIGDTDNGLYRVSENTLGVTGHLQTLGNLTVNGNLLGARLYISATAPTIASGFGTNPSIVTSNGTAAFTVNVGTGGTASAGVITMPAATTGWIAHVENLTGVLGNYANQRTVQIASSTTSITLENQTISTGAALAWTASDVLVVTAVAY